MLSRRPKAIYKLNAKGFIKALWTMFHAILFYPICIGLFIWLYIKEAHWGFGLIVILCILIFDPIWRIMARTLWSKLR